jgi:hypothetical protein
MTMLFLCVCVCVPVRACPLAPNLIQLTRVHETWYECYAIGVHAKAVSCSFAAVSNNAKYSPTLEEVPTPTPLRLGS